MFELNLRGESMKYYIVIGSSRGLGAALVEELLKDRSCQVIGVARTKLEHIKAHKRWLDTGRYCHVELDITSGRCKEELLRVVGSELPQKPICVIFNAALVVSDMNEAHTIHYDIFEEITRVGINGLINVLSAFEGHLLTYGGVLVGISSVSALCPPILDPRVAYPASKAYLGMVFRCLRIAWREKVKVVIAHLGHIRSSDDFSSRWRVPTYSMVGAKLIRILSGKRIPNEINYPFVYAIMYKFVFTLLPDSVYVWLLGSMLKLKKMLKSE